MYDQAITANQISVVLWEHDQYNTTETTIITNHLELFLKQIVRETSWRRSNQPNTAMTVLKLSILETLYSNTLSASNAAESLSIDNSPLGTNIITRLTIYYI